jgi:pyruvate/2-oxoglutarate dehydrogenase complex dihydrolipoamide acyltransferase (E2) component
MTLEDYLSLPHVAPSQMLPGYHGVIDAFLERQGLQRKVAVESPYFGLIPYMLTQTDLVLTTGRQFIRFYEEDAAAEDRFTVPVKFPADALLPAVAPARAPVAGAQVAARPGDGGGKRAGAANKYQRRHMNAAVTARILLSSRHDHTRPT